MKRIRRDKFKKNCPCWFIGQSNKWVRFPAYEHRYDETIGSCWLACKVLPCLTTNEKRQVLLDREIALRGSRSRNFIRPKYSRGFTV